MGVLLPEEKLLVEIFLTALLDGGARFRKVEKKGARR